jgi:hypothetical protein
MHARLAATGARHRRTTYPPRVSKDPSPAVVGREDRKDDVQGLKFDDVIKS